MPRKLTISGGDRHLLADADRDMGQAVNSSWWNQYGKASCRRYLKVEREPPGQGAMQGAFQTEGTTGAKAQGREVYRAVTGAEAGVELAQKGLECGAKEMVGILEEWDGEPPVSKAALGVLGMDQGGGEPGVGGLGLEQRGQARPM